MKLFKTLMLTLLFAMSMLCCTPEQPVTPPANEDDKQETPVETPESEDNDAPEPLTPVDPIPAIEDGHVIVGYAVYWDERMPDPTLVTHINYAFAHIKDDFESLDIKESTRLKKIVKLKSKNPDLKVVLSVGGWGAGNFSEMAADEIHRRKFCDNCLKAVKTYGLDGIDIDWEYPGSSDAGISSSINDIKNFTLLMRDLRYTLGAEKLVTIATSANAKYYHLKDIEPYLNFINIMTYDMGRPPYHHSALYPSSMTRRSCEESVEKHYTGGIPYRKLVLGIPFYGKPAEGESIDYIDLAARFHSVYTELWDDEAQAPYFADENGNMVICFDNETSIGLKAEYIKSKGLLGAMYWNIEADDKNWTLSKALATPLLTEEPEDPETPEDPAEPENPEDTETPEEGGEEAGL